MDASGLTAPVMAGVGILSVLALGAVALAVRASRLRRFLHDMPTSPAAGVFVGDVEVRGTAECDQPIVSFLSEGPCVHHAWSISEHWQRWVTETYRDSKGNTRTRQRLETGSTVIASGGEQIPFYVQDASGVVLVRPEGARIEPVQSVLFTCGADHPSYYGKGPSGAIADSTRQRTFSEEMIPLHRSVFVVGRARERSDMVAAEIAADPDARLFVVTVREEKSVGRGYAIASWVWAILGALIAVVAGALVGHATDARGGIGVLPPLAGAACYLALVGAAWAWMAFNSIVTLRQRVRRAWANIEVELTRRADLLPNIAAVVKASAMHERDTQQVLAVLRAQAAIAPQRARDAEAKVQGVGRAMTAIAEAYPSIAAQPNFLALQRELSNTEARIAIARSYYTGIATAFNARLLVVPDRFLALAARLRPFDLFNATDLEREVPQVRFAGS